MTVSIRVMARRDKPAVVKLLDSTPEFKPCDLAVARELIDSYLRRHENSGYHILVAEDESEIAGYICYGPTPLTEGVWDIYWLAILREKRQRGIGRALLGRAEDKIRKAKARLILIETSLTHNNESTKRFYLGCGYELICRIDDFYAPGDDKITLRKRLKTG